MRRAPIACLFFVVFIFGLASPAAANAQQSVPRDSQAIYLVSASVAAMGGIVPSSSLATGTVQLVEGSLEDSGTIRILTRGLEESREEFLLSKGSRGRVFSRGLAARISDTTKEEASLELAASSQSPCLPLIILAAALNNPDFAFENLGQEKLDGVAVHHIRFWNTFASQAKLQSLAEFTAKDLWLDAASGLPYKLAYDEREAQGDAPSIAVAAIYSEYRNVGGVLYPFVIERIYNGTPWATIKVENVILNTSLADDEFAVN